MKTLMRRPRKLVALLCLALIAFAAFAPAVAGGDVLSFLMPVWLEFQPEVAVTLAPVDSVPAFEQPVSLRSLVAFRGPPAVPSA